MQNETTITHEEKALQIAETLKCKVQPVVFKLAGSEEEVVGFIRKPDLATKLKLVDLINNGSAITGSSNALEGLLIKEYSDERIVNKHIEENEKYWLGACYAMLGMIEVAYPEIKKK
jgi:hypothetical protein